MGAHFDIFKGRDSRYYWRLVGGNGEIVAQSEGYSTKSNAKRAAKRFPEIVAQADIKKVKR